MRIGVVTTVALWMCAIGRAQTDDATPYLMNMASGTSVNPQAWQMPMKMFMKSGWHLMAMGQAFVVETQQSGPRGGDKLFSPNWAMGSAMHKFGGGTLMFEGMLSLDPATITHRSYPLLFQTGETAFGSPLVDAQHPHDFLMSIGVHWARSVGENTLAHLYYAPVGDPALGPVAFPHRASAFDLPQATLGHHWQDSTHIAANVATIGLKHRWLRVEASGFHGMEPDERRWRMDWGGMDSYSGRVTVTPSIHWVAQVSAGRIARPERQEPGDVVRTTASVHYTRESWSSSFIWGRNHSTATRHDTDSFLGETVFQVREENALTGRVEVVDKDELFPDHEDHHGYRVQAYTAGYTRTIGAVGAVQVAIGANVSAYAIPDALKAAYGERPFGVNLYLRFRLQ